MSEPSYIIYITDGEPTLDSAADGLVQGMTGGKDAYVSRNGNSYLSALSSWMASNDVNPNMAGKQTVNTFTIGFSEGAARAEALLRKTAEKGGGRYFDAQNASKLQSAIQLVVNQILEKNASFTSPSVASNNFNKVQTFDSVYYSMFLPNKGPRWRGNIKKFRVTGTGDVVDKNGNPAIATMAISIPLPAPSGALRRLATPVVMATMSPKVGWPRPSITKSSALSTAILLPKAVCHP